MPAIIVRPLAFLLSVLFFTIAQADGYKWRDHAPPFDFLFENHIDTHQQSTIVGKRGGRDDGSSEEEGQLQGFFYIRYTGEVNQGYPEARHGDCNATLDCTVGWILHGIPTSAKLLDNTSGQHPVWCVDAEDLPRQPGYTHFHWLDAAEHAGGLMVGDVYNGYLLKLTARDAFFFDHHGGFFVDPGIDYQTHQNVVVCGSD